MSKQKIETKDVTPKDEEQKEESKESQGLDQESKSDLLSKGFKSLNEKPQFKKMTVCKVLKADLRTNGLRQTTKTIDVEGGGTKKIDLPIDKQFTAHWLAVQFEYEDTETKETKTFFQGFGTLREYDDRLWLGNESALGKLKALFETFAEKGEIEFEEFMVGIMDQKCLVKTVKSDKAKAGFKEEVVEFLEKK